MLKNVIYYNLRIWFNDLFMFKVEYLTFLLISCLSVLSSYCLLHMLFRQSVEYNALSYNKKCYVLKNVTKSIIPGCVKLR